MAKKTGEKFNLSQAIRDALKKNPNCTARECEEIVKAAHPGEKINEKTLAVSWSKLRREGKGTTKTKRVPIRTGARRKELEAGSILHQVQAAKDFIQMAGGHDNAITLIDLLR